MLRPPIDEDRDWAELEVEPDVIEPCVCGADGNVWYLEHMCLGEDYTDIAGNVHRAWVPDPDEWCESDRAVTAAGRGPYVEHPDEIILVAELYPEPYQMASSSC